MTEKETPEVQMDALDLLTEDCWKEILKRVLDPNDLKSCSDACLLFEEILRKRRSHFMFSLVLPHILKCLTAPAHQGLVRIGDRYHLQEWNALLNGRLICKSWSESIDTLRDAQYGPVYERLYRFDSGERIEQFLQKFATHAGNPFLGRRATLILRSMLLLAGNQDEAPNADRDPAEIFHLRMLRQLLDRFGREIWIVQLLDQTMNGHLAFCKNIQTMLGHLPNLRTLQLQFGEIFIADEGLEAVDNMPELTAYVNANPFPDLPQLEHLQASGDNVTMIRPILEKYAPSLKSLALDDLSGFPEQAFWMCNLEELKVGRLDASTSLRGLLHLQAPQLRMLSLVVRSNRNDVAQWHIDELFWNIQNLPIQELRLHIDYSLRLLVGESGLISPETRPYHTSISSIIILFPRGSLSFNFLLYCPRLTSIAMFQFQFGQPRGEIPANAVPELLDVKELIGQADFDLYQSNIWEEIPGLESIDHLFITGIFAPPRVDSCTRVEYEERKLKNEGEAVEEQ